MPKSQEEYEYFAAFGEFWYRFTEIELYIKNMVFLQKKIKDLDNKGLKDLIKIIDRPNEIFNECLKHLYNIADVRNYLFHNGVLDPVEYPISAKFISEKDDKKAYHCNLKTLKDMTHDIENIIEYLLFINNQTGEKSYSDSPVICSSEIDWKYSHEIYQGVS